MGITPCIPGRANHKEPIAYDTELDKSRNLIERLFGRLKDWRRIATRYDRCAHPLLQRHLYCRHGYLLVMSPGLGTLLAPFAKIADYVRGESR